MAADRSRVADSSDTPTGLFRHGVASGDPLTDRVILWTRVTPSSVRSTDSPVDVRWQVASDEGLKNIVVRGTAQASLDRDFTVKVDAGNLKPGATYYYAFDTGGEQSPVGRTRTLPDRGTQRLRLGQVSCSNYPTGYFNVYRRLAHRPDLDAVVHLGDYIYEFGSGRYNDPSIDRTVQPANELVTLQDYRNRYAFYRTDADLQEVHRQHPFIVVWDDHEMANDAWSGGAGNHAANQGDWKVRQRAAYRAYQEWLPIRESHESRHQAVPALRLRWAGGPDHARHPRMEGPAGAEQRRDCARRPRPLAPRPRAGEGGCPARCGSRRDRAHGGASSDSRCCSRR